MGRPIVNKITQSITEGIKLRPYQQDLVERTFESWRTGNDNNLVVLPTGGGKCLGKDTPVMMYDGTVKMVQDVVPGDFLMGPDSKPRGVLTTCTGSEMLYRVTPVKGDPYVVNESHILSLKKTGTSGVVNISVKDYLSKSNTFKHTHKGWRTGINFNKSKVNEYLPPYMLGVWLGDGSLRSASITTMDGEIVDYIREYTASTDQTIREDNLNTGKATTYHIKSGNRSTNSMRSALRYYNLLEKTKFIPHEYKCGDKTQRLELLAGILDTDGHYDGKIYDIVLKQKQLADDLAFVARSLGLAAYVKECQKTATNTGATGTYYRTCISGDFTIIPTKLKRNDFKPRQQKKSVLVTGIKVEPIGVGNYYGFEITGDRLFLLGDFTVTHNTVILSSIVERYGQPACVIAHRQELVSQISLALARNGIYHRIIGPSKVIKMIVGIHMVELSRSFYDPQAKCAVAGVDTLIRRGDKLAHWLPTVGLWVQDEAHHVLKENKWGKAAAMFPNAKGLGVTATPTRTDGAGLGRHHDGLFDAMIEGPNMRDLINMGYLTDYKIYAPLNNIDKTQIRVSKTTGEFNPNDVVKAVDESTLVTGKSRVVGDVVQFYLDKLRGKLSVVFIPSVKQADELERQFTAAGIKAKSLNGNTPDDERAAAIRQFAKRDVMVLINVALFDEGFDLPCLEVVQDAYPTTSYGRFAQRFGRMLRLAEGKSHGIYVDHACNIMADAVTVNHGLPDAPRQWTLDRRVKRSSGPSDAEPLRVCTNVECLQPFPRVKKECPWCGHPVPPPSDRSGPDQVDGDLFELDPDTLAAMRGDIVDIDNPDDAITSYRAKLQRNHTPKKYELAHIKRFAEKLNTTIDSQRGLRDMMAWWGGHWRAKGSDDGEIYRRFYLTFGVDWLSAMALESVGADKLAEQVAVKIGEMV